MILNVNTIPKTSVIPKFTYTGQYEIVDYNNNPITKSKEEWKIRFLTSGELIFESLKGAENGIDVFLVGSGSEGYFGSSQQLAAGKGGLGGEVITRNSVKIENKTIYNIQIGQGGGMNGFTQAFGFIAKGANLNSNHSTSYNGANGANGSREFGDSDFYYGGGGGDGALTNQRSGSYGTAGTGGLGGGGNGGGGINNTSLNGHPALANSGGGGGGGGSILRPSNIVSYEGGSGGTGGSGIVIIRNIRTEPLWEDAPFYGTVNATDSLNVRNIPSSTASGTKVSGTLAYQRKVKIHDLSLDSDTSKTNIWGKIEEADVSGWSDMQYLSVSAEGIINKKQGVTVYSAATTDLSFSTIVGVLPLNTLIKTEFFMKGGGLIWVKISASYNGATYSGYVLREDINFSGN